MPCFLTSVSLLDPETQSLKEHLIDELDYVLVPTEAWNKLVKWYGCIDGQQPIVRKVSMGEPRSLQPGFIFWSLPDLDDVYFARSELRQDPQQLFGDNNMSSLWLGTWKNDLPVLQLKCLNLQWFSVGGLYGVRTMNIVLFNFLRYDCLDRCVASMLHGIVCVLLKNANC